MLHAGQMTAAAMRRFGHRVAGASPLTLFVLAGLLGLAAVGAAGVIASQRAGVAEAEAEVRSLTRVVAETVVGPQLSPALVAGDSEAIRRLDVIVRSRVLDETTRRVKLWDATGRIVYSDEPRLIGESYALGDEKLASLASGEVVSEVSAIDGPENRFETDPGSLLEVYLPIDGPDGERFLYESYFAVGGINESASRIRSSFVPIVLAPLALLEVMHLGLAWWMSRRLRREQAAREQLLSRALEASDAERRRIAADLHDGVVQDLVGTSLTVSAAAESARSGRDSHAQDLRSASVSVRRSLRSLRSLLVEIYPPNLHDQGLEAALDDLLAPVASAGIETELTITGHPDQRPTAAALVYRVVQEAVRNALRHADATRLSVRVASTDEGIEAEVEDDGRGFVPGDGPPQGHFGLRLLADLTAEAGAGFRVRSNPGGGTAVVLEVPA